MPAGLLALSPVRAAIEPTPWGTYDFPGVVRTGAEARAMYDEARVPIVIAIRYLADAVTAEAPWINPLLSCGRHGAVRADYARTVVRASTLAALELARDIRTATQEAERLRSGDSPARPVRYAGPVRIVLEGATVSAAGDALDPAVLVEPHLRIFVSGRVPRCATDATGAFGQLGARPGEFLITATPSLELGWPTSAPGFRGQRIVMATEDLLADGFCCGHESGFGLETLVRLHDYNDYESKVRFRAQLRTVATARQRGVTWLARVRDAFGLPDRYPDDRIQALWYGSGRLVPGEFGIWPRPAPLPSGRAAPDTATVATLADLVMALAWHAHTRAELLSPAILEGYDPERKYSFVGWPEEFQDPGAAASTGADGRVPLRRDARVLEVFGPDRRLSFIGEPEDIAENIAFGFAAWELETRLLDQRATTDFLARHEPQARRGQALREVLAAEQDAVASRSPTRFRAAFTADRRSPEVEAYRRAVDRLDEVGRPGTALRDARGTATLSWSGRSLELPAGSAEELRAGIRQAYRRLYGDRLDRLAEPTP